MPAPMSSRIFSGDSTAGPNVQTILARRMSLPYLKKSATPSMVVQLVRSVLATEFHQ